MRPHLFILLIQLINFHSFTSYIQNCEEFDTNSNTCIKCKDKFFPFFHNLICLPCDDKDYGQIGCGGNCDSSKYENDRLVYCEKNKCKEGFYELEGICLKCDSKSPGCKKCHNTQTQINGLIDYEFTCEKCLSNEYKMNEFGTCEKCQMNNCLECIFTNDNMNKECLKCDKYYYINSEKTCEKCHYDMNMIQHGYCEICSDDYTDLDSTKCYCNLDYYLNKDNTCSFCSETCQKCIPTEEEGFYCLSCYSGYTGSILYNNECLKCPQMCTNCEIDPENENKVNCINCYKGYGLLNGNCVSCGEGCNKCIINEGGGVSCLECKTDYLIEKNKTCTDCSLIDYLGNGCSECQYNETKNKYECLKCFHINENKDEYDSYFSYIKNQMKCLSNSDSTQIYLFGCLEANFIEDNKYECLKCQKDFIPLLNDKTCKKRSLLSLSNECLEAINIGTELNPIYSCNKCNNETVLLTKSNNISDCVGRSDNLAYCTKAKEEIDENKICIECVSQAHLSQSICECDDDSFGFKNLACYKCDDETKGNYGCDAKEGCTYRPGIGQLNCNKCKNGFFEYTKGQCFSCYDEVEFCNKCHLDENEEFVCDECIDNFKYNKYEKTCQLICAEYPEISPGCIICNEEYKSKGKCQACKPGYFKTEDESCVYCRSEKYGGPACDRCIKSESDEKIICGSCDENIKVLNSKGKCYFTPNDLMENCIAFKFEGNDNEEKIVCTFCKEGFYLDNNGNCVSFLQYLEINENCNKIIYQIGLLNIHYIGPENIEYYIDGSMYPTDKYNAYLLNKTFSESLNEKLRAINLKITGKCKECNSGKVLDNSNKCITITVNDCSIISLIKHGYLYFECQSFCKNNKYPLVLLNINKENSEPSYIAVSEVYNLISNSEMFLSDIKSLLNQPMCIDTSENNNINLENCLLVKYLENENKYICFLCNEGYFLDEENNKCIQLNEKMNCEYENIGTKTNPILSCKKCIGKNYYSYNNFYYYNEKENISKFFDYDARDYLLVKENNINFCVKKDYILDNCLNATVDTTYAKDKYSCTSCSINYLSFYSNFYEKYICQNIFEEIKTNQDISPDRFDQYSKSEAINGKCPNNSFFTPDGENCYKCDGYSGMRGCNSKCSFSSERNDIIKCLDGCKDGYIETSEGICDSCVNQHLGCIKCHNGEYPSDYFGIKRKSRFICDSCSSDDYVLQDGKCSSCFSIEDGCNKCEINNNEFKCKECYYDHVLNEEGHCVLCDKGIVFENKCILCNDETKGGIKGCEDCSISENKTVCDYCEEGYVLLKNNKTCLKISENKELEKHSKCHEISIENNKFQCLECRDSRFSVLKINDESMCIYLPELNYFNEDSYYQRGLYYHTKNPDINFIYNFYINNFIRGSYLTHCTEVINLATEENPFYSCIKCNGNNNYLIKEDISNLSYCIEFHGSNYYQTENCKDKRIKIIDKNIYFTCAFCFGDNNFPVYHEIDQVSYCLEGNETCLARNCKQCKLEDKYFCEICEYDNYIVNEITGACMEKIESVPAITWKDIFRLEINSEKEINGKIIKGPKINLRGETNSQINSGHAFIIYLIFKLKQPLVIRNLQGISDTIRIKAICEIKNGVEANQNDVNIVDYECIGENEDIDLSNFILEDIEIDDEENMSNLKTVISSKNLLQLNNGPTIEFKMDVIKNQTSNNYNFDFTIKGTIDDNNIENKEIKKQFKMNEINKQSDCTFRIEGQKNSNLNCKLNIEEYKEIKILSFNTTKIEHNDEYNISFLNLNEVYLINEPDSENDKINIKLIIGIVAGGVAIIVIGILVIYCCLKKRDNQNTETVVKFQTSNIQ